MLTSFLGYNFSSRLFLSHPSPIRRNEKEPTPNTHQTEISLTVLCFVHVPPSDDYENNFQTPNRVCIPQNAFPCSLVFEFHAFHFRFRDQFLPSSSVMHLSGAWSAVKGGRPPPPPHLDDPSYFPNDHYTRPRHSRRRTNGSSGAHRVNNQPRSDPPATRLCGVFKMPPLFNLIRIGIFGVSFSSSLSLLVAHSLPFHAFVC